MQMANTVNDVMNVIASPDYGIKNIASTNQEILAILGGTHNSKNNIHAIVDDIRNLLQTLVDTSTKKNPIEVGNKSAKINPKHVKDILIETVGIRKTIDNLAKKIETQIGSKTPAVAKLSSKASDKVAEAMIKDIEKQKKGGGMTAMIEAFRKLKDISLKDIIFGNKKVKLIAKTFKNAENDLKIKDKDLNAIIKLINAAPEMMGSLKKAGRRVDSIIKNDVIRKLSDILVGKNSILTISKSLQKNSKVFEEANKTSKDLKELLTSLNRSMFKLLMAAIWGSLASKGMEILGGMLNNVIGLSKSLTKNKDIIEKGEKAAKQISTLAGKLLLSSIYLSFAIIPALFGTLGAMALSLMSEAVFKLADKLVKHKNNIDKGAKAAKGIAVLTGCLTLTSIFLTIALVPAIFGTLGAMALSFMVDQIIPVARKLNTNSKHFIKAIIPALCVVALTGIMAISAYFLTKIAKNGLEAILGSVILIGIICLNIIAFKILGKSMSTVIQGAVVMIIMSVSLLLFGIALGKITKATKGVGLKQMLVIAGITIILSAVVIGLGVPVVAGLAALGSVALSLMSIGLLIYGVALGKITKATKDVTSKQIGVIADSMWSLGFAVAGMGIFSPLIAIGNLVVVCMSYALMPFVKLLGKIQKATKNLKNKNISTVTDAMWKFAGQIALLSFITPSVLAGSVAVRAMARPLLTFVRALKIISDMGTIPASKIDDVLAAMTKIKDYFKDKNNRLDDEVFESVMAYAMMLKPLLGVAHMLVKFNEMGSVPVHMIQQTLDAMGLIARHFKNNPIERKEIKQSRRYKRMMRPFSKTVGHLVKLNKMGVVPLNLVYQTLDAMSIIANYYKNNEIDRSVIKQARRYKRMLRPFGKTIGWLSRLKKMGDIPLNLVYKTLDAMTIIANYYKNNEIERKTIKQARRYKRMLRPFGKTVGWLSRLKQMGDIPLNLVYKTLDAMSIIANYYEKHEIERSTIRQARKYKRMLRPFGKTVAYLSSLKKMGGVPMGLVYDTLDAITVITNLYKGQDIGFFEGIRMQFNSSIISGIVSNFAKAVETFKGIGDMQSIPYDAVKGTVSALSYIVWYYSNAKITNIRDIDAISEFTKKVVEKFNEMAKDLQDKFTNVPLIDYEAVKSVILACRSILKYYTFTFFFAKDEKIQKMNDTINLFASTSANLKSATDEFTSANVDSVENILRSMRKIIRFFRHNSLNAFERLRARKTSSLLKLMSSAMLDISNVNSTSIESVGSALTHALEGVNGINMEEVEAVTNMFTAFNGINQSENIINKFTESVKEFTSVCKNLMSAMDQNTDAIINMDTNAEGQSTAGNEMYGSNVGEAGASDAGQVGGIRIVNVDELAKTIAEKINGTLTLDMPDTQVQLYINGTGGNEWTITKY